MSLGRYNKSLEKAHEAKRISGLPEYNLACALSHLNRLADALDELEACARGNTLPRRAHMEKDEALDPLRDMPRFQAILEMAE